MSRGRARTGAVILAALALALPASAAAAPGLEVGMEDERLLLSEPVNAPVVVRDWAEAGVDVVRIHARWGAIAPAPDAQRKPASLDAGNHHDSAYDWETLDDAVDLVLAEGMRAMLTITGPGPLWTSREPRLGNRRWRPDPREYALFSRAVATRYREKVDRYLIWNEPNIAGWLEPQSTCVRPRVCVPAAPHIYRGLVRAAKPVIERADPGAQVLIANLAPKGRPAISTRTPVAPMPFLRELACVDARYRPLRHGRCANFRPASGDAIGYHPHGIQNGPENPNPDRDQAQIGDLARLFTVLDRLTSRGRIRAPGNRFDVYLTEFGYQTSPPDHVIGVSLAEQARYLQQAAYVAWRHPRIRNLTQYQWRDEPVAARGLTTGAAYAGWQSGLRFVNDRPKPVMSAFRSPFVIDVPAGRTLAQLWGQVRPGLDVVDVTVLELRDGEEIWTPVAVTRTDLRGYWSRALRVDRRAKYRFEWRVGDGERRLSDVVDLALNRARRWHASSP